MGMIRILIADDQPAVRAALGLMLSQEPYLLPAGEAADADDLLGRIAGRTGGGHRIDVVLVDWRLPGLPARCLFPQIRQAYPRVAIIVMSGRQEDRRAALAAGAGAFFYKGDPPQELIALIRALGEESAGGAVANGSIPDGG